MKVGIIGTGYVGLVTGACFADSGNTVICADIDRGKIESLRGGVVPFHEPNLTKLVRENTADGRLVFTDSPEDAIVSSDIIFIAVGTPQTENGSPDLSHVFAVAEQTGGLCRGDDYKLIVTKSTVPPGTTGRVREIMARCGARNFDVASNPEFLKEGSAVADFLSPDRVVIGTDSPRAEAMLRSLYSPYMRRGERLISISIRSSEVSKYASNAMLATRISFMNEMAGFCEKMGASISEVRSVMAADERIGDKFLYPGVGYGGSCLPKDVRAVIDTAGGFGVDMKVCSATDAVNTSQRGVFLGKIRSAFPDGLAGVTFAFWGVSFKPNTDDIRESPAIYIMEELMSEGANVRAHDPVAFDGAAADSIPSAIVRAKTPYEACEGADALFVSTEWSQYRQPDFERVRAVMKSPVIFDGRNIYPRGEMEEMGFRYFCAGEPL
ncbi:MAG: UDP-glucose/GDP-mannose dehydrogenase family protein [Candidatus Dadabacteria bacterium]|nr:UDP-glucose/GDP-mannose dehydrogenase family protein [Candidatus Dadabacteria bacterium]